MERIAFLVEHTGVRLSCLLNPESLVIRRTAGIRPRARAAGQLTRVDVRHQELIYTGGGTTELQLDLLFDVTLAGSSIATEDVSDLTRPLVELAENSVAVNGSRRPPLVRFVWGKSWNILGVVTTIAERLEYFTADGVARRSWLRMRLLRVDEVEERTTTPASAGPLPVVSSQTRIAPEQARGHQLLGAVPDRDLATASGGPATERLDEVAQRHYGDPRYWRIIATLNDIEDPTRVPAGKVLNVPPLSALEQP